MKTAKTVLAGATALCMVLVGTAANAETVRASAALPGVVSVKKAKLLRTDAPRKRESQAYVGTWPIAIAGVIAAGVGGYFVVKGDGTADVFDSQGG